MASNGMSAIRAAQAGYAALYAINDTGNSDPASVSVRERSIAGGIVRTKKTTTTPSNGSSQDGRTRVPMPATISRAMSRLLFGEAVGLEADDAVKARLDTILDRAKWDQRLSEAAETASALGDIYLRVAWDESNRPFPIPTVINPSRVIPTFAWDELVSAIIETSMPDARQAGTVWTHHETHTPGRIEHTLYKGTNSKLGVPQPLEDHQMTASLAAYVDEFSGVDTGTKRLTITHVPNALPNPQWEDHPIGSHLGRSDYYNLEDLFWDYSEATRSLMRDVRHGRSRITVPEGYLDSGSPGGGSSVNLDREVYVELPGTLSSTKDSFGKSLVATQFKIRVTEHDATAKHVLSKILQTVGLGPAAIGITDSGQGITATEVHSRDAATRQTRADRIRIWTAALEDFYTTILEVDAAKFAGPGIGNGVAVIFPPDAVPTISERATVVDLLKRSGAVSTKTAVHIVNPDWDDTRVDEEVALIHTELGVDVPEPNFD